MSRLGPMAAHGEIGRLPKIRPRIFGRASDADRGQDAFARIGLHSTRSPFLQPQTPYERHIMAKGQQRSNKEAKKPKKDKSLAKAVAPAGAAVRQPAMPAIAGRGKKA